MRIMEDNLTTCLKTDTIEFDSDTRSISFVVYDSPFGYKQRFQITFDELVLMRQQSLFDMKNPFFK